MGRRASWLRAQWTAAVTEHSVHLAVLGAVVPVPMCVNRRAGQAAGPRPDESRLYYLLVTVVAAVPMAAAMTTTVAAPMTTTVSAPIAMPVAAPTMASAEVHDSAIGRTVVARSVVARAVVRGRVIRRRRVVHRRAGCIEADAGKGNADRDVHAGMSLGNAERDQRGNGEGSSKQCSLSHGPRDLLSRAASNPAASGSCAWMYEYLTKVCCAIVRCDRPGRSPGAAARPDRCWQRSLPKGGSSRCP